jgi:hypothetical protein
MPLAFPSGSTEGPKLLKHFGMERDDAFTSLAALAALAPAPNHAADTAIAPPAAEPPSARTETFRVVFFRRPGCRECDRVREILRDAARDFPAMLI